MMSLSDSTLVKLKVSSEARQAEENRIDQRKRNLMVLILDHLQTHGYLDTADRLQNEANISASKVTAADNIDLLNILQEYESFYVIKFGRPPKLTRKVASDDPKRRTPPPQRPKPTLDDLPRYRNQSEDGAGSASSAPLPKIGTGSRQSLRQDPKDKARSGPPSSKKPEGTSESGLDGVVGTMATMTSHKKDKDAPMPQPTKEAPDDDLYADKLLKPLPDFGGSEFRELATIITRDIFMQNPNVRFTDIAGLSDSKRLLKEAVVYPMRYPELFTGLLTPWKGILLYGPPGTGKTMLAKAVATECRTTFFNISASSIVSKWRGDSEKLVRVLFELARYHAPSTIFLDEIESIMSQRTSDGQEHEGSRRMKTELLIQMDGLAKTNSQIFFLAATNMPWDLDVAMLRRLEKRVIAGHDPSGAHVFKTRHSSKPKFGHTLPLTLVVVPPTQILIDLPDPSARATMFRHYLPSGQRDSFDSLIVSESLDYESLATQTDGYSGSDIRLVCKEAAMRPLRLLFEQLDTDGNKDDSNSSTSTCQRADFYKLRRPIEMEDVELAIQSTKSTSTEKLQGAYERWQKDFGSV
ncbi:P-loop containing nucleoside triphosphate hydrolase protein [Polychytrium aggregatum]|uniref:P-loop containing nucleoside triphosphate hydrolase protein n=1 Tax=Polychytrium aggregatum TaxID=110093 RepID=UPI0022FEFAB9|nr:P-loop containing nucleoside triphosphate hydrolase protein [Polychytrium aggregatum]KAI9209362.1 P-loop containing nucleoside triphosphate hydrolase protein [Polychytrium aggregatum]